MGLTGPVRGKEVGRLPWSQKSTKHKNWRGVIHEGIVVGLLPPRTGNLSYASMGSGETKAKQVL